MNNMELLNQCVAYFKANSGFKRPLLKIKEKYRSLGTLGGTIVLDKLTIQEKEALGGFLKKNYGNQKSATIKVDTFEKALLETRFESLNFTDVLEGYFGEKLISKKDEKESYEEKKRSFFLEIVAKNENSALGKWVLAALETKEWGYQVLSMTYDTDWEKLQRDVELTGKALQILPYYEGRKERLAFFASKVSKNPHTFDEGTSCHKLLLYALMFLMKQPYPENAEERAELLYKAGIIKDDISNYTNCFGLLAYHVGKAHSGWQGFIDGWEPIQVSLWNLAKIDKIVSYDHKVFVVENPTVFSGIIDEIKDLQFSLVCTNGQVKLASLILLDQLVAGGSHIYYGGDFDPEGLIIADKLKERYKEKLTLWRFTKADYTKALSNEDISQSRMKKLDRLQSVELRKVGEEIKIQNRAGYQELLMEDLIEDIVRLMEVR